MKNIILFPGTDAIENPILRTQALQQDGVLDQLIKTEDIVKDMFEVELNLVDYMTQPNDLSLEGFRKLVLCSLATQVAIYNNYVKKYGNPDCVMGLSLGDVPRSVVAGLVTYKEGVRNLFLFTSFYNLTQPGLCVHVKLTDTFDNIEADLELEKYGVYKSVIQNERFGLLAGPMDNVKQWMKEVATVKGIKFRPMYPFPLHTEMMRPVAEQLEPFIVKACTPENLKVDVFSTVYGKILHTRDEFIEDCTNNISAALDFPKAIDKVIAHYKNVRFVNMGPSDSLMKFLSYMSLPESIKQDDWYIDNLIDAA